MTDSYLTVTGHTSAEIKIQKSLFIANSLPVKDKNEIQNKLAEIRKKYYDASHHPFAYILGIDKNEFRYSDDGEPAGSSGKPVYDAIAKYDLSDTLVIVTRYYGGIKLGTGGLRRAYFDAADLCLGEAKITEMIMTEKINAEFDYKFVNAVMNFAEKKKIKLLENNSDEKCRLKFEVRLSLSEKFKNELIQITNGGVFLSEVN